MDKRQLVSYCGLYCGLCDWRTRVPERAKALAESLQTAENEGPEGFSRFLKGPTSVPEDKCCRSGKCGAPHCAIRKCAIEKSIETCPQCQDYPCRRVMTLAKSEPTLLHDGERIREHGLDQWIEEQEERRRAGFCYADIRCLPCEIPHD